ncbi:MAG: ABC transporter permease [Acidobacteria bacterium]|nr:ABC transporter permease [Acidobacteriota bacterium]
MFQDLRYGARMLVKQKGFAAVAILTLGLGIGANTAIFSVVNAVLLRPLPYPDPQQLVRLFETVDRTTMSGDRQEVAPANFFDWRERSNSFTGAAVYSEVGLVLSDAGEAEQIKGALASVDFFSVVGVPPYVGRTFTAEDERSGGRFAVISFDLWQRRFGGSSDIVGRSVQLDGFGFTVTGVMQRGFSYPRKTDLWELYSVGQNQRQMREARFLKVIARLKPGTTVSVAQAEMSGIAVQLAEEHPRTNRNWSVAVVPLLDEEVGSVRPALALLFAAVGLVLLIACSNVGSLMLARNASRRQEISVRQALGASRFRVVRQLLTESVLLAVLGGAAGVLLGRWGLDLLLNLAPKDLPRLGEVSLDLRVLAFTMLVSLATGVLFGLAPAWQSARRDVGNGLREGTTRSTGGPRRIFGALVAAETALALMILTSGALLAGSFLKLQMVNPGVDVERLLTVSFEPPSAVYNGRDWRAHRLKFWHELSPRLAALPGVEAVGAIETLPFAGRNRVWRFRRDRDDPNDAAGPAAVFQVVTEDYFRASGMTLRRGRNFTVADGENSPPVAIINETMARRFWPDGDALGQRIVIRNEPTPREIIGIVGDIKGLGLDKTAEPEMYAPFNQFVIDVMPIVIRVAGDPASLTGAVREQVRAVDPQVAIATLEPMTALVAGTLAERRFTMTLLGLFALIALILAVVGIYGVTSYVVAQRTRDIGIRMALGAQSHEVVRRIIAEGLKPAGAGIILGLCGTLVVTRMIAGLLFGLTPHDPAAFVLVVGLLLLACLLACYFPARRAAKIDPIIALRRE